jgi:non-heme Fe2+,alpha-ketoglutarate-dependent halogenase
MTGSLHIEGRQQYERDGVAFPFTILDPAEVARFKETFEQVEPRLVAAGGNPPHKQCHLCFRWAYDLATHPAILDLVEDLIGPDILIHNSTIFAKPPRNPAFVSWHQDAYYFQDDESKVVAAWIALTPSTSESGCMRALAGSHKRGRLPHVFRSRLHNMINIGAGGLHVDIEVDETDAVDVALQPGQISLHHGNVVHSSNPNNSDGWRIGFAVRYITPDVRMKAPHYAVVLARGQDLHGHYKLLQQVPAADIESGIAAHVAYRAWHSTAFASAPVGRPAPRAEQPE